MDSPPTQPAAEPLNYHAAARQGRQALDVWYVFLFVAEPKDLFQHSVGSLLYLIIFSFFSHHISWFPDMEASHFKVCFHLEAEYGERWGEGAARYFSIEADFLDEARVLLWNQEFSVLKFAQIYKQRLQVKKKVMMMMMMIMIIATMMTMIATMMATRIVYVPNPNVFS